MCSMKWRPTRSCSFPTPAARRSRDASSSRAFSIPPVARTTARARTVNARPVSVRTRNALTPTSPGPSSISVTFACTRVVTLAAAMIRSP